MPTARYDGHTEWYEAFASAPVFAPAREAAIELLGAGPGRCLDLGCGTGLALPLLVDAGWDVVGTDASSDQLASARARSPESTLLRADAHELPFADGELDGVVSILTHTDFDDVFAVFGEVQRVLRPGGVFAYVGVHPCFGSPYIERRAHEPSLLHLGYRDEGWQFISRDPDNPGIRSRVGFNHATLATLLAAVGENALTIATVVEPGETDPPLFLGFRAEKR